MAESAAPSSVAGITAHPVLGTSPSASVRPELRRSRTDVVANPSNSRRKKGKEVDKKRVGKQSGSPRPKAVEEKGDGKGKSARDSASYGDVCNNDASAARHVQSVSPDKSSDLDKREKNVTVTRPRGPTTNSPGRLRVEGGGAANTQLSSTPPVPPRSFSPKASDDSQQLTPGEKKIFRRSTSWSISGGEVKRNLRKDDGENNGSLTDRKKKGNQFASLFGWKRKPAGDTSAGGKSSAPGKTAPTTRASHRSEEGKKKKKVNRNWENVDSLVFDVSSCSEDEETLLELQCQEKGIPLPAQYVALWRKHDEEREKEKKKAEEKNNKPVAVIPLSEEGKPLPDLAKSLCAAVPGSIRKGSNASSTVEEEDELTEPLSDIYCLSEGEDEEL